MYKKYEPKQDIGQWRYLLMYIIPVHAERKLHKHLQEIETRKQVLQYHALYLTISWLNLDQDSLRGLYLLIENKIDSEFGRQFGYCYMLTNGDILILSNSLSEKQLKELGTYIQHICLEDIEKNKEEEIIFLTLNPQTNWPTLMKLSHIDPQKEHPPVYEQPQQNSEQLKEIRYLRSTPLALIVDNEGSSRLQLADAIEAECDIIESFDVKDALESYKLNMPDCVYLDLHLPDGSGLLLISAIRELDPDAHIIVVSSDTDKNVIQEAKELGAKGYLTKPFSKRQISNYLHIYNDKKNASH